MAFSLQGEKCIRNFPTQNRQNFEPALISDSEKYLPLLQAATSKKHPDSISYSRVKLHPFIRHYFPALMMVIS